LEKRKKKKTQNAKEKPPMVHLSKDYPTRYQETSYYPVDITHTLWTKGFNSG
jgi:hypothetical protein